jgi:hypothetical protein
MPLVLLLTMRAERRQQLYRLLPALMDPRMPAM